MTKVPCMVCSGIGTVEDGRPCPACNGDKEVTAGFGITEGHMMAMFQMIVDILDSVNDIKDSTNDIKEKVDEIKGVVDAL